MGFSLPNLIVGFVLAILIMAILPQLPKYRALPVPRLESGRKLLLFTRNLLAFLFDFLCDLTLSNLQLAWDIWTPGGNYRPRLVKVPVADLTPLQITLLSSRITLTPGTLSMEITSDKEHLIVHVMYPGKGDVGRRLRRPIDILNKGITP